MTTSSDVDTLDGENGNCKQCGHLFEPHLVTAYDVSELSKGGELRCHVGDCNCFRTLSFDRINKQ